MEAELGAKTLQVTKDQPMEKFIECVKNCLGDLPDITIDASGFEATMTSALKVSHSLEAVFSAKN